MPGIRIAVASKLPVPHGGMNAFRNSYHFDGRTLHVRRSRLGTIGEFGVVVLHALAHIKVQKDPATWDDSDEAFVREFYGLMELMTEEMFFTRLPAVKAVRERQPGRKYRPDAIMSTKSLAEVETRVSRLSPSERENFIRTYFQFGDL